MGGASTHWETTGPLALWRAFWVRAVHLWNGPPPGYAGKVGQRSLRDMNVDVPLADSRRIEVLANGQPLWQGAQDMTFVSPVSKDGSARAGADRVPGKAAADAGRRKR